MSEQPRIPRGVPTGGEFAGHDRPEASISLPDTSGPWPAIGREKLLWEGAPRAAYGPGGAEATSPTESYYASLPAEIAVLTPEPSPDVRTIAEDALMELSRFDAELGDRVAAFGPVLLRSEAASSSHIEQLTASARQILTAELGVRASRNAEQIIANTQAMQAAIDLSDEVNPDAVRAMHEVLMKGQDRHTPGKWRTDPVWIGTGAESPAHAEFVGPDARHILPLLDDLSWFARRGDIQPLVLVAVAHAQFETIHPFSDGNGRTGRAFVQALLRHHGVTRNVAVPVSAGLLANVEAYHLALTAYRAGDVDPIVGQFAGATLKAIANARQLVADMQGIRASWDSRVKARRYSTVWLLLNALLRRPVVTAAAAAAESGVHRQKIYDALGKLTDAGILVRKNEHRSGPVWRSDEILGAIDAFTERAGRRSWS